MRPRFEVQSTHRTSHAAQTDIVAKWIVRGQRRHLREQQPLRCGGAAESERQEERLHGKGGEVRTRLTAARRLNGWIATVYSQQWPELLSRIKHDAHRLFDLFCAPAGDDEWWPQLFAEIAAAGGRAKHLLEALLELDPHFQELREFQQKCAASK
jgi:hypothetical protein